MNSKQQFSLQNALYTSNRIYSQCVCFSTVFLVLGYLFATWFHISFLPPFQVACCFPEQRAMSTKSCLRSKKQCRLEQKTNMNILLVPKGSSKKAIRQTFLYYRSSQQSRVCAKTLRYIEQQRNAECSAVALMKTNVRYASPFLCSNKINLTKQLYTGRDSPPQAMI